MSKFLAIDSEIKSITALRGLACISVCIGHFAGTISNDTIFKIFHFGIWGVNLFFIISGFILSYTLYKNDYKIKFIHKFLLKRIIRIDPPFIISILIVVIISYLAQLSPHHTANTINLLNLNTLYNILYIVDFVDGTWLNVVFWTLAIEFQFYILLSILYPIISKTNKYIKFISFSIITCASFIINDDKLIFHYLLYFIFGIIIFQLYINQINEKTSYFWIIILCILLYLKFDLQGVICPLIFLLFFYIKVLNVRLLIFIGKISYSLYLLHTPLGTDSFVQFFQNYFLGTISQITIAIFGILFAILCSYLYYYYIESKFQLISKKIKYS